MEIIKVKSPKQLKQFIDFPHELYKDDPHYVPELFIAQKKILNQKKNPFFNHSQVDLFLAIKNGKAAGRIAAIRNGSYESFTKLNDVFFGFFDVVHDIRVADALLNTVKDWARLKNADTLIGPVNPSTNDPAGLLIDGYNSAPVMMMAYNKKYYEEFLVLAGFRKKMDLLAYVLKPNHVDEKTLRVSASLEQRLNRRGIIIRKMNLRNFQNEVNAIHRVYNSAWEKNWGFVPMTKQEFDFAAEDMKQVVDPDFAYIAEHHGKPVGFSLTIPNINEVLIKIKRGRLLPTGLITFLFNRNKVKSLRVITLGVIEGYRKSGIDACFYARNIEMARKKKYEWAEASWILENNEMMNRALQNIGGQVYKKYRIYEQSLK